MTEMNDGGPAFPGERIIFDAPNRPTKEIGRIPVHGMSLRDWFAGQALAGLIAQCNMPNEVYSRMAYTLADTMLQQRELTD